MTLSRSTAAVPTYNKKGYMPERTACTISQQFLIRGYYRPPQSSQTQSLKPSKPTLHQVVSLYTLPTVLENNSRTLGPFVRVGGSGGVSGAHSQGCGF